MDDESIVQAWVEETPAVGNGSWHGSADALRAVVAEEYADLPQDRLEWLVTQQLETLSPEEAEDFWKGLAGFAAKALPVVAPIVGTVLGGPLGGMLGGAAGRAAGQALGGVAAPPPAPRPAAPAPPALPRPGPRAAPAPVRPGAPPKAALDLLGLLQNPALMQGLLGQVLGPMGRSSVPVGPQATPAPFGAFMNALSVLANQAAAEAEGFDDNEAIPEYLRDRRGNPLCDPAVPEERATVLLQSLRESRPARWATNGDSVSGWLRQAGLVQEYA